MKDVSKDVEHVAIICHEVNKSYCEGIGDDSQKSWVDAEQWQQESAVRGVIYAIEHPDVTASDQHVAWMNDKIDEGWVYGEVKDAESKTHPCLVSYNELPQDQKIKDMLFRAIVTAFDWK